MATPLRIIGSKVDRTCGSCHLCARQRPLDPRDDVLYLPSHLVLEVTNQCNLDCIMCERRLTQPDDMMSLEIFDQCAANLVPFARCTELSGLGEPTLAPLFPYMAGRIYSDGQDLYFPTNGAGLSKKPVLDSLLDSPRTKVSISIDAATPETYARVRVDKRGISGDWDELWRTIKLFRSERPNAWLGSCFTAGAYNVDDFPGFVRRAIDFGFNEVAFKGVRCWAIPPEENSLRFRKSRTEAAFARAFEIAASASLPLKVERPFYSEGFEDAGEQGGLINYLDILPLSIVECGGGSTGTVSGITGIGPGSFGIPEIVEGDAGVYRAPRSVPEASAKLSYTPEVMVVLSDGTICSCGAKHPIGHVSLHTFDDMVKLPDYQGHLRARAEGNPLSSKWCTGCEKMF